MWLDYPYICCEITLTVFKQDWVPTVADNFKIAIGNQYLPLSQQIMLTAWKYGQGDHPFKDRG